VPNRLAGESSPYLLQHAHNPVDWLPWGDEAFERARAEDKPVLLSIGYSSCHWCHVMERESFEDPGTAALMNEAFVSVKVDREERPDVDAVYMRAVQALTGHGGWPLTVFLTPDAVPYYGGTYFPPEPRHGMPSFRQVLSAVADAYRTRKEEVLRSGEEIRRLLARSSGSDGHGGGVDEVVLAEAYRLVASTFDAEYGGFGGAPKFPQAGTLELLLHHHARTGGPHALDMVVQTLRAMAHGGIRDHLAGGFHRYTVDRRWLVPHFEKMLYDNALLLRLYVAGWQASGDWELRDVARETASWLLSDMRHPEGGFYSAWDADSEGEEGKYYVWSAGEIRDVLGAEPARLFGRVYDVSESGNWEGNNILNLPRSPEVVARSEGIDPAELERVIAGCRRALLEVRARRVPPLRDDKVLVGWNGMVLRALAEGGAVLGEAAWIEAARAGVSFLLAETRRDNRLLHVWKDGDAKIGGFLEDYAALGNALLSVHEATLDPAWLGEARWCVERVLELFWDGKTRAFYDTASDAERLVVRPRDVMDNATPSGNSLAADLLERAARVFGDAALDDLARQAIDGQAEQAKAYSIAFGRLLSVATRRAMRPVEVAIVGPREDADTVALARAAAAPWLPQRIVVGAEEREALPFTVPLLQDRGMKDGRPTAYVCSEYVCKQPVQSAEGVARQLAEVAAE
jgi:uncharacterized protein YyaL (SSP411 family)